MPKITRANIAAARAQRDILVRRNKEVPAIVQKLAELDPDRLPKVQSSVPVGDQSAAAEVPPPPIGAPSSQTRESNQGSKGWAMAFIDRETALSLAARGVALHEAAAASSPAYEAITAFNNAWVENQKLGKGAIYLVDEDNVGRAEHYIHEGSKQGAGLP